MEIEAYIAAHRPRAAIKLLAAIEKTCEMLADWPEAGRARAEIAPGIRSTPVGWYVIFYRTTGSVTEILRVLHGRRDTIQILRFSAPPDR